MRHYVSLLSLGLLTVTGCHNPQEAEDIVAEEEEGGTEGPKDDDDDDDDEGETAGELPAKPTLELAFAPIKQFVFSWASTYEADYYQLLERPEGSGDHLEIGEEIYGESVALTMPLHLRSNASYVLRACNPAGCTDSAPIEVTGSQAEAVGYFKPGNTSADDLFGWSMAISGDGTTLAVAALAEDGNGVGIDGDSSNDSAQDAGAVYVFRHSPETGNWTQQAYVKPFNTNANDYFGWQVALSHDGDTLAVSAIREDSKATGVGGNPIDNSVEDSGAVYVYEFDPLAGWWQQAYIKASNTSEGDTFGAGLALSSEGDTLAVGAPGEDSQAFGIGGDQVNDSALGSGAVYVFQRNDDVWAQQAYLKASNTGGGDDFGQSMALAANGDVLVVGAPWEDSMSAGVDGEQFDDSMQEAGAVYVFTRDVMSAWSQEAYLKSSNPGTEDWFGARVALSADGSTLAIGARGDDSSAVGLGGDPNDDSAQDSGAVYVFRHDSNGWMQESYVKASNPSTGDSFGADLALSSEGDLLVIGAAFEDGGTMGIDGDQTSEASTDAGAVYVMKWDAMAGWRQQAYVKASNAGADDRFGENVALAGDGQVLMVGAAWEDGAAVGVGGEQADDSAANAGAVYMY